MAQQQAELPEETLTNTDNNRPAWFSNPMDWRPIDRFILLGSLVLLAPGMFGIGLIGTLVMAPEFVAQSVAYPLVGLYLFHIAILLGYIFVAVKRRRAQNDWPAFENVIIGGFILDVMVSSYLTGSHFTEGLLLLFLGVNITSTLARIEKIRFSYWFVIVALMVMAIADFSGYFKAAPLMERSLFHPDGSPVLGWLIVQVTTATTLSAIIYLCILAVSRWVERENLYREMSTIDGLTRLTNRRSFIERGQNELARVQRRTAETSSALACIMIDLDHFKRINDTWGHHAGDAVLVAASEIMMENARRYDEVGRYGGEEFAILLPSVTIEVATTIAERLRKKICEAVVETDGHRITITASLGVACYPGPGINDLNDLLKAADRALYNAKESGRNRVVIATTSTDVDTVANTLSNSSS
jgi:diguanylate cyclase